MADSASIATFVAFTGASEDVAQRFLEMSGGDIDTAVNLFLSDDGPHLGQETDVVMVPCSQSEVRNAWFQTLWPCLEEPPAAWRDQRLDATTGWQGGISQPLNGPCGVLASLHALILGEQHGRDLNDVVVTPEITAEVIFRILARCRPDESAPVLLARPKSKGQYGPSAAMEELQLDLQQLRLEVKSRIAEFSGPGGIIDLLVSCLLTRGLDRVRSEVEAEGGELPLVTKAFNCWLCTTELLSLLLRGTCSGNVGAFTAAGERNLSWEGSSVGLLSSSESSTGIPVADGLKQPEKPIWILHGGDHFTLAWCQVPPPRDVGARFRLYHWNGLPPGGPRLTEMSILATKGTASGGREKPRFFKPEVGEIDEVVQADPSDKKARPDDYRSWCYEVLLARENPDLQGEVRPADLPPEPKICQETPEYQRAGPWRCASCYANRFKTMDFSLVPADIQDHCPKCQKSRKDCGWSLWMPFSALPPKFQAVIMDRHAKKIETILWTKWPNAEITALDGKLPDC